MSPSLRSRPSGHVALLGRVQHPQRQRSQLRAHGRPLHRPGWHLDDLQRADDWPGGRLQPPRQRLRGHPGDSGGALYAGSLAQGITSGGTVGGCSQAGFRSFFQPVGEALSTFGLTLL